jgi:hypothetical protein
MRPVDLFFAPLGGRRASRAMDMTHTERLEAGSFAIRGRAEAG